MNEDRGLVEFLDALRWRWKLAVMIALGVTIGAFLYVQRLPSEYKANSVVALAPRPDAGATADTVRVVAPKYVAFLTAPATIRSVALQLGTTPDAIGDSVEVAVQPDSGNLTIAATSRDPELATEAVNALMAEALGFSADDELLSGEEVAAAVVPTRPSGPPRLLLEVAALLVGVLAGLTIALLVERGRPRIRGWRDIAQLTGYTTLARVPRSRMLRFRPREAFADPDVGSAFRTLRTNVERFTSDPSGMPSTKIISVTSAVQGDGKTTIAALYAESLSRLGTKTLLVDADLARAAIASTFGLGVPNGGTTRVLREEVGLSDAVQSGWVEDLDILVTMPDPDAGDVLARNLGAMLEEMSHKYDAVILDGPPLIGTDEGRTIATMVSAVILVVSGGEMSGPVHEAVLALEDLKVPVIGAVANRMRRSEIGQAYR